MSNKTRNIEATLIHRPVVTGRAISKTEAAVCALILILLGEDLLEPSRPDAMWRGGK